MSMPWAELDPEAKLAKLDAIVLDAIGGPRVASMLVDHYAYKSSLRSAATRADTPKSTARREVAAARSFLEKYDLWPENWQDPAARPAP